MVLYRYTVQQCRAKQNPINYHPKVDVHRMCTVQKSDNNVRLDEWGHVLYPCNDRLVHAFLPIAGPESTSGPNDLEQYNAVLVMEDSPPGSLVSLSPQCLAASFQFYLVDSTL